MTLLVLQLVLPLVAGVLVAVVRGRRARVRRAAVRTGGTASCPAWLGLGTQRPRRGELLLGGDRLTWTPRRGGAAVELGGSLVLAAAQVGGNGPRPDDVTLRLSLPWRATGRLRLHAEDAATVLEVLHGSRVLPAADPVRDAGAPRRPRWPLACLALAALWVGAWLLLVAGGDTVTATTTGGDGQETCGVAWTDAAGTRHTGEVTCDDGPPGTRVRVFVLGWPVAGEPVDAETTEAGMGIVAGLLGVPAVGRLLWSLRRGGRRPLPAAPPPAALAPARPLPALDPDDVLARPGEAPADVVARLLPRARTQVPDDGWERPRRPAGARSALDPRRVAPLVLPPLAVLVAAVVLAWPWPARWLELRSGPTETVHATSTGVAESGHGPFPGDVAVRYRTGDGVVRETAVATDRDLPAGTAVDVVAGTSGGAARLAGDGDALGRAAGLGSLALALALGWAGWAVRALVRLWRAVHRAAAQPARPALGMLTADGTGRPLLLVCDPLVQPVRFTAVPLQTPLPHGTAAALTVPPPAALVVHGRLADGEVVVPGTPAGLLLPAGPARTPDAAALLQLLDSASALARSAGGEDGTDG